MALVGSIAISMQATTAKFTKGLNVAAKSLNDFAGSAASSLKTVGLLGAGLTVVGGLAMTKMISSASTLAETTNKLEAIFGKDAKSITDQANLMADAFGVSRIEFTDAAARIGQLFKGAGYSAADASKLSVAVTKLSNDAASFNDVDFQTAFNKIRSGLAGEAEPLRDFGIMLSEDSVKAFAYSAGLARLGTELSAGTKVQARLALITKGLSDAQGDAAKTADGVANSTRGLWGRVENLATSLGESLLPIAQVVLGEMQIGVTALTALWTDNSSAVGNWAKSTLASAGVVSGGMGFLQKSVGWVADAFHYVAIVWKSVVKDFLFGVARIVEGLGKLMAVINPTGAILQQFGLQAGMDFGGMADKIKGLGDAWQDSFVNEVAKPLPSEGVNEYFDRARRKITDARAELAKPGIDVTKLAPTSSAVAKAGEAKFASASDKYSRESVNMQLRSRYGSSVAQTAAQKTAENTKKANEYLATIAGAVASAAGLGPSQTQSAAFTLGGAALGNF
jgi:hypothetical protein